MRMADLCLPDVVVWAEGQLARVRAANLMEPLEGSGGKKEAGEPHLRDLFGKADAPADAAAPAKKGEPAEDKWDDVRTCSPV